MILVNIVRLFPEFLFQLTWVKAFLFFISICKEAVNMTVIRNFYQRFVQETIKEAIKMSLASSDRMTFCSQPFLRKGTTHTCISWRWSFQRSQTYCTFHPHNWGLQIRWPGWVWIFTSPRFLEELPICLFPTAHQARTSLQDILWVGDLSGKGTLPVAEQLYSLRSRYRRCMLISSAHKSRTGTIKKSSVM